jgi:hypothetical protein
MAKASLFQPVLIALIVAVTCVEVAVSAGILAGFGGAAAAGDRRVVIARMQRLGLDRKRIRMSFSFGENTHSND